MKTWRTRWCTRCDRAHAAGLHVCNRYLVWGGAEHECYRAAGHRGVHHCHCGDAWPSLAHPPVQHLDRECVEEAHHKCDGWQCDCECHGVAA